MGLRSDMLRKNRGRKLAIKRFRNQLRRNALATPGHNEFIIVLDHLKPRYNIGKIFRSADAFGARQVNLVGIEFFDPAPAMGSFKWVPARFFDDFSACLSQLEEQGYQTFFCDPSADTCLTEVVLPKRSAFVFGHEEYGFSFDPLKYGGVSSLAIPQYGKVQSLNVSVAASLTMYEYIRQQGK